MSAIRHYTASDLETMPDDGNRYEIIDGTLFVTPSPGGLHQFVAGRLYRVLSAYLEAHNFEDAVLGPADITLSDDTVVIPDLFVADFSAFRHTNNWRDVTDMYLAVEIVSPSSERFDRGVKRARYQRHRVPQYWVVDVADRSVAIWTPDAETPDLTRTTLTWRHPHLQSDCMIDVASLFREIPLSAR